MDLRVATWNLNHRAEPTWDALATLPADVVLVQEARPPANWTVPGGVSSWPPIDEPTAWTALATGAYPAGVVLLNADLSLRPKPDASGWVRAGEPTPAGTVVVADIYAHDDFLLTVASVYAMFQPVEGTAQNDAYQTMNSVIDDLTPVIQSPEGRLLLAGDFNLWRHTVYPTPQREAVFHRLDELGMVDCIRARGSHPSDPMPGCVCGSGDDCDNVRTYRHMNKRNSRPWQNDYLFASAALAPTLASWQTLNDEIWWSKSDHCPVLATFVF